MDITASLESTVRREQFVRVVDDLATYTQWKGLVHSGRRRAG